MIPPDEKARRANAGLNFQTFNEANLSTPRGPIEPARLRNLTDRLHALGERPLYEFFSELLAGGDVAARLERYARLDPAHYAALAALMIDGGSA
jgi:hypothetical protein